MTDLTFATSGPDLGGSRLLRTAAAVMDCYRWALAMQMRYDRLGARGFRPGAQGLDALMASLDPDARSF